MVRLLMRSAIGAVARAAVSASSSPSMPKGAAKFAVALFCLGVEIAIVTRFTRPPSVMRGQYRYMELESPLFGSELASQRNW